MKEFIRQIRLKGFTGKLNIIGWDISDSAIDMARFIVNYEVKHFKDDVNIAIEKRDALDNNKKWNVLADFILMNPPFISWEVMDDTQRANVSAILGELNKKRPNTASAFLWNAVNCMKENSVLGCVIPTSISVYCL